VPRPLPFSLLLSSFQRTVPRSCTHSCLPVEGAPPSRAHNQSRISSHTVSGMSFTPLAWPTHLPSRTPHPANLLVQTQPTLQMRAEGTPADRGRGESSDEEEEALLAALAQQADAFGTPLSLAPPSQQYGQQYQQGLPSQQPFTQGLNGSQAPGSPAASQQVGGWVARVRKHGGRAEVGGCFRICRCLCTAVAGSQTCRFLQACAGPGTP